MKVFSKNRRAAASGVEALREELGSLNSTAREGDCEAARQALRLRHQIGLAELERGVGDGGHAEPSAVPVGQDGLPEVSRAELTASAVRGAILDRGCLLVRGLVDPGETGRIVAGIDRALAARDARASGEETECGDFEHFSAESPYGLEERSMVTGVGGLWTVDSPFLAADVFGLFDDHRIIALGADYLQEQPLVSVQKGTLRKVDPQNDVIRAIIGQGAGGGWHQDGQFLGSVKALNVWISLSHCGDVAPGMDLVPRRLAEIAPTGTEGAPLDWAVAEDVVRDVAGESGVVRPVFSPGDALFFDEMFLHTTAIDETMTEPRYAIETWFFGPSAYPREYAPIAL
jgi:hypothetical protein